MFSKTYQISKYWVKQYSLASSKSSSLSHSICLTILFVKMQSRRGKSASARVRGLRQGSPQRFS